MLPLRPLFLLKIGQGTRNGRRRASDPGASDSQPGAVGWGGLGECRRAPTDTGPGGPGGAQQGRPQEVGPSASASLRDPLPPTPP